jgi:hypothetical protein
MQTLSTAVRRRPMAAFVLLAYVFSWWPWPLYSLDLSPAALVGFGPFLAALVVSGLTGGRSAVKDLLRQIVRWRIGLRWYALALGLPVLVTGLAAALNVLLGAPAPGPDQLGQWPSILPSFFLLLLVPGIGGAWEEPGWRGFALPRLAARRSQLAAVLPHAIMITGWHLPLLLTGIIPWADLLYLLGTVVIFNRVYYGAGKSVLIIMIFHAMNNAVGQYFPALFSDGYAARLSLLQGIVCSLVALLVIVRAWRFWAGRLDNQPLAAPQPVR